MNERSTFLVKAQQIYGEEYYGFVAANSEEEALDHAKAVYRSWRSKGLEEYEMDDMDFHAEELEDYEIEDRLEDLECEPQDIEEAV